MGADDAEDRQSGLELSSQNPTEGTTPGEPDWWLRRLGYAMDRRDAELRRYDAFYRGDHPLAFASEDWRKAFGGLFSEFADNWCDLVVDAVEERLNVEGFRLVPEAAGGSAPPAAMDAEEAAAEQEGDQEAWDIWQRNYLDSESQIAHTEALINGEVGVLVWWGPDGEPEITVEHPRQLYIEQDMGHRWRRRAALKRFEGDDGHLYGVLYLPTDVWKFRSRESVRNRGTGSELWRLEWEPWQPSTDDAWPLTNRLGVVPAVPLCNRPRLLQSGVSELKRVIPVQNAVNKLVLDMMVGAEYQSFRQRWITGVEIPRDPETNQALETWKQAIERVWLFEPVEDGEQVQVGELSSTDLANFTKPIETLVQHIASQTRTPPHYFYLSGQFPSGESIKSAETGLVAKSRRKMRFFGEAWEEVIRLAFAVKGDKAKARARGSEAIWGDPESRSEAEHTDAVTKQGALGVPQEILWEKLGYSPQEIRRMKALRDAEALSVASAINIPTLALPSGQGGPAPAPPPGVPAPNGAGPAGGQ